MITLTGTLRQFGEVNFAKAGETPRPLIKLWIEHETPRGDGPADLKIEELTIPISPETTEQVAKLKQGGPVTVEVQQWAKNSQISFKAVRLLSGVFTQNGPQSVSGAK